MSQHNDPTSPPESQLLHWSAAVGHGLPASDPQRKPWTRFLRDNWTRYQHATLDAVNTGNDIRMALRARMGVAMYGDRGTGKTYALVAAFVHLAEMGMDALLVSEADLYDQLRRDMEREPWEERMVDRYLNVEALLIDDLGKANVTAWTASAFFNVIDTRYRRGLVTCITSNFWGDDLAAAIDRQGNQGRAIVDRLGEMCGVLAFTGESLRAG